ncbi:hypothetical protein J3F84DRAFT_370771 [Trichoderma pleuroticola]
MKMLCEIGEMLIVACLFWSPVLAVCTYSKVFACFRFGVARLRCSGFRERRGWGGFAVVDWAGLRWETDWIIDLMPWTGKGNLPDDY